MISGYTNSNTQNGNMPFMLKPTGKDYLWGGSRLRDEFSKEIDMDTLAETWECSTHPDGPSFVAGGEYDGLSLTEVLKEFPEYLGENLGRHKELLRGELPILIKLIDAKEKLSIQVHPDDEYAKEHEDGAFGKTEMWYVLDAKKDAELVYGFYRDISEEELRHSLSEGTVEKHLHKVKVKKDDVFFVDAGIVHGIGAGALIAEVQENSNITYRLFDYNRKDKEGKTRPLHVEKALQVANRKGTSSPRQPMRVLKYQPGFAAELLCRCEYFQVERFLINTEKCRRMVELATNSDTFWALLCIDGCGTLYAKDTMINFFRGDCIFVPANSVDMTFHGKAQFLRVSC